MSCLRGWSTGGPAYRWNEIILDELRASFVTLPLAARHLVLLHAAVDDAVAIAGRYREPSGQATSRMIRPASDEPDVVPAAPGSAPSVHATAVAASELL